MEIGGRHIKDVDSVGEDEDCVEGYKRTILNEGHITRDTDATSRGVITTITLMFRTIPQKNTLDRLGSQLSPFARCKQDITCATKNPEMIIVRRYTKKNLTRAFASKFGGRLLINTINSSRDNFSPKNDKKDAMRSVRAVNIRWRCFRSATPF